MDFLIRIPFLFFLAGLSAFLYYDKVSLELEDADYKSMQVEETFSVYSAGTDKNYANMVAIQPYMIPADYSTRARLFSKLDGYFQKARNSGLLKERTTVIFPEHIGTPIYLIGEKKSVYAANTLKEAYLAFQGESKYFWESKAPKELPEPEEFINDILNKKAENVTEIYQGIFSELARNYKVNILAGTILLPELRINNGRIELISEKKERKIYGFMFSSQGSITQKVERKNLFDIEKPFATSGVPQPEGIMVPGITNKLAVILSCDTFSSISYTRIIQVTDFWVSPAIKFSDETPNFADISNSGELNNPSRSLFKETDKLLSPRDLWLKFGIQGRHSSTSSKSYMQVFLNGKFYDLGLESWSNFQSKQAGKQGLIEADKKSAILNIFL